MNLEESQNPVEEKREFLFLLAKLISGFPADFFSRKCSSLLLERANAEGEFFLRRFTGFTVTWPVTSMLSLALLQVLARNLQLTVKDNESRFRVSFHVYWLSPSSSSLLITSRIAFGITLGISSIVIFQIHGGENSAST